VAFVQCAGSRDENHLPYCSYICCMASLKQATYVRERYPDAEIYIFYIDLRTPGQRYEKFYKTIKADPKRSFHQRQGRRGERRSGYERCHRGGRKCRHRRKDPSRPRTWWSLPPACSPRPPASSCRRTCKYNADGFILNDYENGGMFAAGCAHKPADVVSSNQNATGMALKAIQTLAGK
jgi:quinone-modifying oxidoreductase, subunit QmoA